MKDHNTPPVPARSQNPTARKRLRLHEAQKLKGIAARARAKRDAMQSQRVPGKEGVKAQPAPLKIPRTTKNTLTQHVKPISKFRKRQTHKSWLPTHLFHAKRAHMTPPKEPLWNFSIPTTPNEKSYRMTHRAGSMRGCMAWDMSYMSSIGIEGVYNSLLGILRCLGVPESMLEATKGRKWRKGTRSWKGWLKERDKRRHYIAQVEIVWCVSNEQLQGPSNRQVSIASKDKRKLLIRVHPSAFLQLWIECLNSAKMQRPPVSMEDLRYEIGSIEVTGPGATDALVGVLTPITKPLTDSCSTHVPEQIWSSLASVTNPGSLPAHALLCFTVSDPRLRHPPRPVELIESPSALEGVLQTLATWPPDNSQNSPQLFDRTARLTASRLLQSQKSVNRRKSAALSGSYPTALSTDPQIPIVLLASRSEASTGGQGTWTLLLPWKCVVPVWYSLMYYPISTGGSPRFGGLQEKRQISFEQGIPWFPADFPGTRAGWEWELNERIKRKFDWEKRPKGKRIVWNSVDLGGGRRGEIGLGWACDWERLFNNSNSLESASTAKNTLKDPGLPPGKLGVASDQIPPLNIHCIPRGHIETLRGPPSLTALVTVAINLIHRGVPTSCARIYRLPSTNAALHAQWLALAASTPRKSKSHSLLLTQQKLIKNAPLHEKRGALADSAVRPSSTVVEQNSGNCVFEAGDPTYPIVPDEIDLIGFVTTGNFNLGEGRGTGIGCIVLARVCQQDKAIVNRGLCIVREVGMGIGRVASWELV